jgi:Icc-related predicted phosphoesterase
MRVLAVADIHYALRQFDWLASVAGQFDAVVLAGDLLEISSAVDRRAQIVVVRAYLSDIASRTRLIVCSGNHDLDAADADGERSAHWMRDLGEIGVASDGGSVSLDGTLLTACGWWDGAGMRASIEAQLSLAAKTAEHFDRWVWVYHAPPAGRPVSWAGSRHYGDPALPDWIARFKPDIVLCGHVHTAPFVVGGGWADRMGGTWVFNAGHQIGPVPAHMVLDLGHERARAGVGWSSIYEEAWIDLDQPPAEAVVTSGPLPERLRVIALPPMDGRA